MEKFLLRHATGKPVSFHVPGHKGTHLYNRFGHGDFLRGFLDYDITEIEGSDNLFESEGIIKETADRYAALYEVSKTYLLVNGSTCGIMAAILSSVSRGGKLIMARNSNKSVFNAVRLGGIQPIYAIPRLVDEWGISGQIHVDQIKELLLLHPEAEAVILPSPNYYGICSDIQKIAEIVHAHGKILIVDQAHGAHLIFFNKKKVAEMPPSAEMSGADLVINSTHKTLASMTQSSILNVCTERVDRERVEDNLQLLQSSSPSYILMASLDINATILEEHGDELIEEWRNNLYYFYQAAGCIEGLRIIRDLKNLDKTKLNLDMSDKGYSGRQLERVLMERYGIYPEWSSGNLVMCMTGIGNRRQDYDTLLEALRDLSNKPDNQEKTSISVSIDRERMRNQVGKTCARGVIPYPPGIPLICQGETILKESVEQLILRLEHG